MKGVLRRVPGVTAPQPSVPAADASIAPEPGGSAAAAGAGAFAAPATASSPTPPGTAGSGNAPWTATAGEAASADRVVEEGVGGDDRVYRPGGPRSGGTGTTTWMRLPRMLGGRAGSITAGLLRASLALVVVVLVLGRASAQEVTGTLTGTVDGEEANWVTFILDTDEGPHSSATWNLLMDRIFTLSIQGHRGARFHVEGAIAVSIAEPSIPSECPCSFDNAEIFYWTSSSMLSDVYTSAGNSLTLTSLERLDDGTFSAQGTFSGTLMYQASPTSEPDAERTIEVEGAFDVQQITSIADE